MSREKKVWTVLEVLSKGLTVLGIFLVLTGEFHVELHWEHTTDPLPTGIVIDN